MREAYMQTQIAGALYDFSAFLTTRPETLVSGAAHRAAPIVEALEEWADDRGLDLEDADVLNWDADLWPDPSPEMIDTPEFEAVWQAMKGWDIESQDGEGYSGTTGNHVRAILDALASVEGA